MGKRSPDHVDIEVGRRIRSKRLASGLSQTQLANRLGLTFQQIQKYENGSNRIGAGRLSQIAQVFAVPVSSFFSDAAEGEGRTGGEPKTMEYMVVPGALRLLKAYSQVDDSDLRQTIVSLVEHVASLRKTVPRPS